MERKLASAQDERKGDTRSILRALRLALARSAGETVGLAMSVIGATQARRCQEELEKSVPEESLLLVLAGPEDQLGAACIDLGCVTAIVQQQTMGQVMGTAPAGRPFTGTDAALSAPLIDALLERVRDVGDASSDHRCLAGFQVRHRSETRRSLVLALEVEEFRVFELTIDIAAGRSQGRITLILPDPSEIPVLSQDGTKTEQGPCLEQGFGVMRADLNAVVSRIRLPLSAFAAMKAGDVLPLFGNNLDKTEMLSVEGKKVAVARLGQCRGMRAVRMNEKLPEANPATTLDLPFTEHGTEDDTSAGPAADPNVIEHSEIDPGEGQSPMPTSPEAGGDAGIASIRSNLPDPGLPSLSPEQAAVEITELAGIGEPNPGNPGK